MTFVTGMGRSVHQAPVELVCTDLSCLPASGLCCLPCVGGVLVCFGGRRGPSAQETEPLEGCPRFPLFNHKTLRVLLLPASADENHPFLEPISLFLL